jgi:uncharacterized membrane protein YbhN (UPF0104 family)
MLATIRSHDQFNTTIYSNHDRYRGLKGLRTVVFMNQDDMRDRGLDEFALIDVTSFWKDGTERAVHGYRAVRYEIPPGCAAGYMPELNVHCGIADVSTQSEQPVTNLFPAARRRGHDLRLCMATEHPHRVHLWLHRRRAAEGEEARALKRSQDEHQHRLRKALIDLSIVALLMLGAIQLESQFGGIGAALETARPGRVVQGLGLEILSELGFVLAFLLVMDPDRRLFSKRRLGRHIAWTQLGGGMLLPAGAAGGPGIAAWALHKIGMAGEVIARRSLILLFLNSAVDFVVVIVFGVALYVGLLPGSTNPALTILPAGLALAVVILVLLVPRVFLPLARRSSTKYPKIAMVLETLARGVTGTVAEFRNHDWRLLGPVAYWAFDNAVLYLALMAIDHPPPVGVVVMAYVVGALGGSIPIPAGLGSIAGMAGMLVAFGMHAGPATAAVLVYQATSIGVAIVGGAIAYVLLRRNLKDPELRAAIGESP